MKPSTRQPITIQETGDCLQRLLNNAALSDTERKTCAEIEAQRSGMFDAYDRAYVGRLVRRFYHCGVPNEDNG